ncbi:MAG TPA: hypothetical protein VFP62_04575, partial [Burkholderiales bacterium]|nr:hypothetical protein [Burkholderiales bacterium]
MDFHLAVAQDGDVLIVTFSGRSTEGNARAMTMRYFGLLADSGKKKVLADIRQLQGRLSTGETYLLVHELRPGSIPAGIKTAILELEGQRAFATFLETVLVNVGVPVRCVVDREEALAW